MNKPFLILVSWALTLSLFAQEKPNILVIWGDDVGWGNVSANNHGMMGYQTPNIDRLAKEGAMFTDWYAQQSCTAGRAALILGQHPFRTGLLTIGMPGAKQGIQDSQPTIAELLKPHGYTSGQFGKNHLGDRDEHLPTNHGFDEFFGNLYHLNAEEEPETYYYPKDPEFHEKFGPRGVLHSYADGKIEDTGLLTRKRMETADDEFTDAAIKFIKSAHEQGKPIFVWLSATRMHVWTHLKEESIGVTGIGLYPDGMVEHDKNIGKVLKVLEDLKIIDNTIIMYSTDNGAEKFTWPVVQRILMVLLADGNLLLEGLPGLAKTRAINSQAKNLDAGLSRIQFTPDLLPSDITGTEVYQPESEEKFMFQQGPIFNNLILADEINRAPAKVQSALLEAMQERQVTVAGTTHQLDPLFMVMATQNPIEQEGTYPLPEAQMNRFLMHVIVNYPDSESEKKMLDLIRNEDDQTSKTKHTTIAQNVVFNARKEIKTIHISDSIKNYIVDLINATRYPEKYTEELDLWIDYGASPRASIALDKCSRVQALLNERDFVNPDDVRAVVHDILRHRITPSYEANAEGISKNRIIDELLKQVAVA